MIFQIGISIIIRRLFPTPLDALSPQVPRDSDPSTNPSAAAPPLPSHSVPLKQQRQANPPHRCRPAGVFSFIQHPTRTAQPPTFSPPAGRAAPREKGKRAQSLRQHRGRAEGQDARAGEAEPETTTLRGGWIYRARIGSGITQEHRSTTFPPRKSRGGRFRWSCPSTAPCHSRQEGAGLRLLHETIVCTSAPHSMEFLMDLLPLLLCGRHTKLLC